jgi:hypothetical protein
MACRATKTVVVRAAVEVFWATVIVAVAGPLADAGLTLAQTSSLVAVQAQPEPDATLTVPAPPGAPIEIVVGEAE